MLSDDQVEYGLREMYGERAGDSYVAKINERKQITVNIADIDTVDFNDDTLEIYIKDELGGIHSEGLGWSPDGSFCGECNRSCVGCSIL
jgi:hypothetical protein